MSIFLLALGGAIGAVARYLFGLFIMKKFPNPPVPTAMLVVNVSGSFGLGAFLGGNFGEVPLGAYEDPLFLFIGLGFFGAFTTYSTFSVESAMLIEQKEWRKLLLYIGLSILGSIITFLLGFWLSASIFQ